MDIKSDFELVLNQRLKQAGFKDAKFAKNKIRLFCGSIHAGDVFVVFLRKANGYYAGAEAYGGPIHEMVQRWSPQYKSALLNDSGLSFNSLPERSKCFGDSIGGTIDLPAPDQFEFIAERIVERLSRLFVQPVINYITGSATAIDDVVKHPDRYAYPLATVLAAKALNHELDGVEVRRKIAGVNALAPRSRLERQLLAEI